jgi:hypothetical protein
MQEANSIEKSSLKAAYIARVMKDLPAFGVPSQISHLGETDPESASAQILASHRSAIRSHINLLVTARTFQGQFFKLDVEGCSLETVWVENAVALHGMVKHAVSAHHLSESLVSGNYIRRRQAADIAAFINSRSHPVGLDTLEHLEYRGPFIGNVDFAVGYDPKEIRIRKSRTDVPEPGRASHFCFLRLSRISPNLSRGKSRCVYVFACVLSDC